MKTSIRNLLIGLLVIAHSGGCTRKTEVPKVEEKPKSQPWEGEDKKGSGSSSKEIKEKDAELEKLRKELEKTKKEADASKRLRTGSASSQKVDSERCRRLLARQRAMDPARVRQGLQIASGVLGIVGAGLGAGARGAQGNAAQGLNTGSGVLGAVGNGLNGLAGTLPNTPAQPLTPPPGC